MNFVKFLGKLFYRTPTVAVSARFWYILAVSLKSEKFFIVLEYFLEMEAKLV